MLEMIGTLFWLCNFGGLTMRSFEVREEGSGSPLPPASPPLPPPLQEEKKSPVLRINALSFWNHSWTQLNSNRSIQICSLTFFPVKGEYLAVTNLDLPKAFSELFCQSLI